MKTHLARIKDTGLAVKEEFDVDCCYANQDKFWVQDPDGARWEIYVLNRDIDAYNCDPASCAEPEPPAPGNAPACCEPACCR